MAQTTTQPAFPTVAAPGRTLHPGRWTYGRVSGGAYSEQTRFDLHRASYEGSPAWLMLYSYVRDSAWTAHDTLWATIDEFKPLFRVGRIGKDARIEMTYRAGEVVVGTTQNGFTQWKVKELRDSTTDSRNGSVLRLPEVAIQLRALPLAEGWKGSIPLNTETDSWIAPIWMNLAVDGEEEVVTPAGRFLCWRIRTTHPDFPIPEYRSDNPAPGVYFWVSKDRRWLVQTMFANQRKEPFRQVLVSAQEE